MSRILLQPASGEAPRRNYERTIRRHIPLSAMEQFLSETQRSQLASFHPSGGAQVWGLTPNRGVAIHPALRQGDPALFYGGGSFYAYGFVTTKVRSAALADSLWGKNDKGESFEYVYFLNDVRPSAIDLSLIALPLGRNPAWRVMGAELLDESASEGIIEALELVSEEVPSSPTPDEYRSAVSPPALGAPLEREGRRKLRVEQAYLRDVMFGRKATANCAICGEEFSVRNLVAAHIKKRADCSTEEKLDVGNVALPMCKYGCDALFEAKAVVGRNGSLELGDVRDLTPHELTFVHKLSGRTVRGYRPAMEKYFHAHGERL